MRTLRDLARDRIVLIVAHRAGTLAACDRIVFASAGSIVATGSNEELSRTCAPYREYLSITESEIEPASALCRNGVSPLCRWHSGIAGARRLPLSNTANDIERGATEQLRSEQIRRRP